MLRRRAEALGSPRTPGRGDADEPIGDDEEEAKAKKKEEKKKANKAQKEKEEAEKLIDGRHASKAVKKEMHQLYAGTGLDQREKVRRRVLRRAKNYAAKKKAKEESSSSSDGDSSTSSQEAVLMESDGVFTEESKARAIAERFPGALAMEGISQMKRSLLTAAGEELDEGNIRPIAVMYYRGALSKRAQGAQARELLNLSTAIDALLLGKVASALDIMFQRLKAQENILHGTAWSVAQQVAALLMARGEMQEATRQSYQEARTRWLGQQYPSTNSKKGDGKSKGKNNNGKEGNPREERKDERGQKGKGDKR